MVNSIELSYLKNLLKILKAAQEGNRFLKELTESPDLNELIKKTQEIGKNLKAQNYKEYKIESKFKMVKMEEEYNSIYNRLCASSHNNLSALLERHFNLKQDDFSIIYFKRYTMQDCEFFISLNASVLIELSTQELHKLFNSPVQSKIEVYQYIALGTRRNSGFQLSVSLLH